MNAVVHFWEDFSNGLSQAFVILDHRVRLKELHRHGSQCLFWPVVKPVECAAADERWEVSTSDSELIANRRHAKDDMTVQPELFDEGQIDIVLAQGPT